MKIFYDTEFIEGTQTKRFLGIPIGKTKPTIDLISIGMVCEDGREYTAISKDFNIREAWNRHQPYEIPELAGREKRHFWIRENVLMPIYFELEKRSDPFEADLCLAYEEWLQTVKPSYRQFKKLIRKYGKPNKQIAIEICRFIDARYIDPANPSKGLMYPDSFDQYPKKIATTRLELFGYFADYDHCCLCWLYGKMNDLPKGFPYYTTDLMQMLQEQADKELPNQPREKRVEIWQKHHNYPKQINEHSVLDDARWHKALHYFITRGYKQK